MAKQLNTSNNLNKIIFATFAKTLVKPLTRLFWIPLPEFCQGFYAYLFRKSVFSCFHCSAGESYQITKLCSAFVNVTLRGYLAKYQTAFAVSTEKFRSLFLYMTSAGELPDILVIFFGANELPKKQFYSF